MLDELRARASAADRLANRRTTGLPARAVLGVPVHAAVQLARPHAPDHALAEALWRTGLFEARLAATQIADPAALTAAQMQRWSRAFGADPLRRHAAALFGHAPAALPVALRWLRSDSPDLQVAALHMLVTRPPDLAWDTACHAQLPRLLQLAAARLPEHDAGLADIVLGKWAARSAAGSDRVTAAARRMLGARAHLRQRAGLRLLRRLHGRVSGEDVAAAMRMPPLAAAAAVSLTGTQYAFLTAVLHAAREEKRLLQARHGLTSEAARAVLDGLCDMGLMTLVQRRPAADAERYYQFTERGSAAWQAFTRPDWAGFVREESRPDVDAKTGATLVRSVVTSMSASVAEEHALALSAAPRETLVRRHVREWQATYWQRLPFGHEVTVRYPLAKNPHALLAAAELHRCRWRQFQAPLV